MPDISSPRSGGKTDTSGLLSELWRTGIWKLFLLLFLYIAGATPTWLSLDIPTSRACTAFEIACSMRPQPQRGCNAGYGVIIPVKPTLMTDFFASRHSDVYIHCEDYTSQNAPEPCRNAHSDAVNWESGSAFVSNTLLSFILVSQSTTTSQLEHCPLSKVREGQ